MQDQNDDNILKKEEIAYYSRQLILPEIGYDQQLKIKQAKVLVVGVGGLGSSLSFYLAGSGVGLIGLVDYDKVELSNLHRQIIHNTKDLNKNKTLSAKNKLQQLNPFIKVVEHNLIFDKKNAMAIIDMYDVVCDCSDNVNTRYLVNDVCVSLNKILISGSAVGVYGQLMVYNVLKESKGPCYRCIYEKPPKKEFITNCSEGGVLGAVTGVIGSMQAIEAIKTIVKNFRDININNEMILYDAMDFNIQKIKMRSRDCNSRNNTCLCELLRNNKIKITDIDYDSFCNNSILRDNNINILDDSNRISAKQYFQIKNNNICLIDVRSDLEYKICRLNNSINIPLKNILNNNEILLDIINNRIKSLDKVIFYCRRGNDSQLAVNYVLKSLLSKNDNHKDKVCDIIGGLYSYNKDCNSEFPIY